MYLLNNFFPIILDCVSSENIERICAEYMTFRQSFQLWKCRISPGLIRLVLREYESTELGRHLLTARVILKSFTCRYCADSRPSVRKNPQKPSQFYLSNMKWKNANTEIQINNNIILLFKESFCNIFNYKF